jgi:hypothetical protein
MFEELSLHILDIGMNSLAAGVKNLDVIVIENTKRDWLIIRIRDDGLGMDAKTLNRVLNRNLTSKKSRSKPLGLGLAFLRQTAEMCGGTFHLRSAPGRGTTVTASMRLSHIDRPPMGDLNATILALCAHPGVTVRLWYRSNGETFCFSSKEGKSNEPGRTQEAQGKGATAGCAA